MSKHIGVLTSGGDCPGLNAAIRGLGKALVEYLLAHPDLEDVDFWTLTTGDAHGLYTRHGFRFAENDGQWMTLDRSAQANRSPAGHPHE